MDERLGETRYVVYQSCFGCIRQSIRSACLTLNDEIRIFLYLWDAVNGYIDHRILHPRVPWKELAEDTVEYLGLVFRGIEMNEIIRS